MSKRTPLFVPTGEIPARIRCAACPAILSGWHGTAAHGLAHERRGEAIATSDPYCPSTSGHRYEFWLPPSRARGRKSR